MLVVMPYCVKCGLVLIALNTTTLITSYNTLVYGQRALLRIGLLPYGFKEVPSAWRDCFPPIVTDSRYKRNMRLY